MNFFFQLLLNLFFFILYGVIGYKLLEMSPYANLFQFEITLTWMRFIQLIIFFSAVVFFSIASSFAMAKKSEKKTKKGIPLDDKDLEVTPDVTIDGKEDTPESLIDIIDDKTGKVISNPKKAKKNKKK